VIEAVNKLFFRSVVTGYLLAFAWPAVGLAQENELATEPEHHAHKMHDSAPELAEGQRWETDAPLREAMLRVRDGVSARTAAFHNGTLSAAGALRIDPESADGLPQLVAVLRDYGVTFDDPGWEPLGA
jgi:hypothetical protein